MPLRLKYPISDWVLGQDNLSPGDVVAFFCEVELKEVHAEVIGFPSKELRQYISCRRLDGNIPSNTSEVVNFYNTIVYKLRSGKKTPKECTCGAKYTSNPKHHLSYCEVQQTA